MTGDRLPCETRREMFDATSGVATILAAGLCHSCPSLGWCVGERRRAQRDGTLSYFEGTWAGKLYRSRSTARRSTLRVVK